MTKVTKTIPEREVVMEDAGDILKEAATIHTKGLPEITMDATLGSSTDETIVHNKLARFIRDQMRVIRIIGETVNVPQQALTQRGWETKYAEDTSQQIQNIVDSTKLILFQEVILMMIQTRTPQREVLMSMLMHGLNNEDQEAFKQQMMQPRTIQQAVMQERRQ